MILCPGLLHSETFIVRGSPAFGNHSSLLFFRARPSYTTYVPQHIRGSVGATPRHRQVPPLKSPKTFRGQGQRRKRTHLTSKCASRHNGVHFFHISTSKSRQRMVCLVHVYFKMCFAPQRRAIFHLSSGQLPPYPPL